MTDVHIYCINLNPLSSRYQTIQRQLDRYPSLKAKFHRFQGRTYTPNDLQRFNALAAKTMTPSQKGCALSHVLLWEEIARTVPPEEYVMVLEDDCIFVDGFEAHLQALLKTLDEKKNAIDFCYLGCFGQCHPKRRIRTYVDVGLEVTTLLANKGIPAKRSNWKHQIDESLSLYSPRIPVGFHAYLIKSSLCQEIQDSGFKIKTHIDYQFFLWASKRHKRVVACDPQLAYQPTTTMTTSMTNKQSFPVLLNRFFDSMVMPSSMMSHSYFLSVPFAQVAGVPLNMYTLFLCISALVWKEKALAVFATYSVIEIGVIQRFDKHVILPIMVHFALIFFLLKVGKHS